MCKQIIITIEGWSEEQIQEAFDFFADTIHGMEEKLGGTVNAYVVALHESELEAQDGEEETG